VSEPQVYLSQWCIQRNPSHWALFSHWWWATFALPGSVPWAGQASVSTEHAYSLCDYLTISSGSQRLGLVSKLDTFGKRQPTIHPSSEGHRSLGPKRQRILPTRVQIKGRKNYLFCSSGSRASPLGCSPQAHFARVLGALALGSNPKGGPGPSSKVRSTTSRPWHP
jgi:hypothetical protein